MTMEIDDEYDVEMGQPDVINVDENSSGINDDDDRLRIILSDDAASKCDDDLRQQQHQQVVSPPPSSSSTVKNVCRCEPIVSSVIKDDTMNSDRTLSSLIAAANELAAYEQNDWAKQVLFDENTDLDLMWKTGLEDFHRNLAPAIAFIKQLPGYSVLSIHDRCTLYKQSLIPLIISQLSLPSNSEYSYFGMTRKHNDTFCQRFPQFQNFTDDVDEICAVMKQWNPSAAELSLLRAFLFYQEESASKLSNPELVRCVNQRLKVVLTSVMNRSNSRDLRLRYFMRAYDLLRCTHLSIIEASSSLPFSSERTDVLQDQLYSDLYVLQKFDSFRRLQYNPLLSGGLHDWRPH